MSYKKEGLFMKYNFTARTFELVFSHLAKQYYKEHPEDFDIKPILKKVKKEYSNILYRTPGIHNSLESNLIGASYLFAMAKKIPHMTPQKLDEIIDYGLHSPLLIRLHAHKNIFSNRTQNKMVKEAQKSMKSTKEMDWTFTYQKGKDEFYLTYTRCGICKLAQKENVMEYLPCMCKMDYAKYEMVHAHLERTMTLAHHEACCDFHVTKSSK